MPKRRDDIRMSDEEVQAFLELTKQFLQVATLDNDGWPQLSTMGFGVIDGMVHFQGYGKSQKMVNLRRDPRLTVMVESGKAYDELVGVVIKGRAEFITEPEGVAAVGRLVGIKHFGGSPSAPAGETRISTKRIGVRVVPTEVYSWDHRKLPKGVH